VAQRVFIGLDLRLAGGRPPTAIAAFGILQRCAQDCEYLRLAQRAQHEQPRAGEQRAVDLEVWVLGRCADQDDRAILNVGQ
jgi:hypothetical protein